MADIIVNSVLKGYVRMRDRNRIKPFLIEFESQWQKVPFMRFGQLIENLSSFVKTKYDKDDLFYMEDTELMNMLKEYLQHCK